MKEWICDHPSIVKTIFIFTLSILVGVILNYPEAGLYFASAFLVIVLIAVVSAIVECLVGFLKGDF